jgi:protein phosphatase
VESNVEVEIQQHPVHKGDIYLLCSDGLSDMVEDDDMVLTISTFGANLNSVAQHLIQLANDNGGKDNISVVMAQVLDSFPVRHGIFDRILKWFS